MRRTFLFCIPTLLRSLNIQTLSSLLLWLFYMPIVTQALAAAPITPSGLNTQVSAPIVSGSGATQTTQYNITGGTRPGGGTNLFHSFGDFNVPNNNIANFLNSGSVDLAGHPLAAGLPTANILGRVTAGNPSIIFGMIQTNGAGGFPNANLFLMNPAGFLFGPNATVNVGGMVAFTTADYLRLKGVGGNGTFYADPAQTSVLTSSPVAAFGFLGSNPAAIAVQGSTLTVAPGQSISLVGGNKGFMYTDPDTGNPAVAPVPGGVTITGGKLSAPGGQINLASVASPDEILAGTLAQAPNINGQSFGNLSAVQITEQSVIDVSGNGGGTVLIRGGQFLLDNSMISATVMGPGPVTNGVESIGGGVDIQVSQNAVIQNRALIDTSVMGNATPGVQYGGVHIKADQIQVSGIADFATGNVVPTVVQSDVAPGSSGGNSGNITLEANSITMKDFTVLDASVGQIGGQPSALPGALGNAGNISITTNQNLQADFTLVVATTTGGSTGSLGNIALTSTQGNISLGSLTQVSSQSGFGGNTGNVTLSAPHGDILLAGATVNTASGPRGGALGSIHIDANNLQLVGGFTGNSVISGDNFSSMTPGNISLHLSGSLNLADGSIIETVARVQTPSAPLNITAHDITIASGSFLSTASHASGTGGPLNIFTNNLRLTSGGQIKSGSTPDPVTPVIPSGAGGTITVQGLAGPAGSVLIDGAGSGIFTNTVGTGAAGNTNIAAQSVTIQNGGTISASTSGTARSATGGAITINANQVQINNGGLITAASTGQGAGGAITINSGGTFSSNAGTVSSTATQATGGDINIAAGQSVSLSNGSSVSASSTGTGNAGSIHINAGQSFTATNSKVTTEAGQASGGTIKITTAPSGTVQLTNSTISASVLDGTGGGGSVNIDPQFVILQNSQILAQAVQGPGGNISITTNLLLPDANSVISASSQFGVNGTVTIQSPNAPASGKIQPLGKSPLLATTLLNQRCAALAGGDFSSFTVAGRDSLPAEPGSWLASPLAALSVDARPAVRSEGLAGTPPGASLEGETALLSLRQIAPDGFLTQAFAVDWSAGCQS